MTDERTTDRRHGMAKGSGERTCPWCRGRLVLRPSFPLDQLISGETRARTDVGIPESMRLVRAWVCATPHCKFREAA